MRAVERSRPGIMVPGSPASGAVWPAAPKTYTVRLRAFQPRLRVCERNHPKLYWVDPGVVRAVKKLHGPIAPEERGALLEGWVLHLPRARRGE